MWSRRFRLLGLMIDLHSHTNQSDGTSPPVQLVEEARRAGLGILAITDHDTFDGYDRALPRARETGLELICGIELSTKLHGQPAHLLGYFLRSDPPAGFRTWVGEMQISRRDRNVRLVERMRELGFVITLAELESRARGMTGRLHLAQLMVEKGYAASVQQAFDDYLGESGQAYVYRREPQFAEAVERIREAGGIASMAHPVRLHGDFPSLLPELRDAGLSAIEAYHSDHSVEQTELYLDLAQRHGLLVTGGSDYHGAAKPGLELGTGRGGNLRIPEDLVDRLRTGQSR
jgi:predicted metal-dependent phosphoesterase TrpH